MADFFIDPMREEHIWEIARLEAVCFSSPRPAEALRAELTNDTAFFFTAVCEGTVAAMPGCTAFWMRLYRQYRRFSCLPAAGDCRRAAECTGRLRTHAQHSFLDAGGARF